MPDYCAISDVYEWIPPGSVQNPARLIADIDTATEILSLDNHGLSAEQEILFRTEAGGTLPSPLVAGTTYYAIPLTDSTFSVSATKAGAAIDLTTAGTNVVVVSMLPWDSWINKASAKFDEMIPAHKVPLVVPVPEVVTDYVAGMVAEKALSFCGTFDSNLDKRLERARADAMSWSRGKNLRNAPGQSATNLAVRASVSAADPRGWAAASGGNGFIP